MAELSSVISSIRGKSPEGEPTSIIGALSGFGSVLGIIAAAIGLLAGISLVPLTSYSWELISTTPFDWILEGNSQFSTFSGAFMGLLAIGLLLQAQGSKDLRAKLGGMFGNKF